MYLNSNRIKQIVGFLALAFAILASGITVLGQETRGVIKGVVTDPNGATIAGATVTVSDPARGQNVSLTSNDEGFFQANYLLPGIYRITVESAGFKKFVRENVLVEIGAAVQVNIPLEVGGTQETVTVTTDLAAMNTENASLGQVIDGRRLQDLPLVHGDPYKLIGLAPGVAHTGSQRLDRPFEPTHIVGYAIDGTRGNRSDLTIDGAPSTATANGNEVIASYVPPSDIVQEFKVQTATFDAQFGNTEGGVTSISIKSGTNSLNGSAYYFGQPGQWAANDFFGNSRGQARPETKSDRFGGYISGPVYIPWLYKGKDKTFFLFGYEGIRDSRPRFDAGAAVWVPTQALVSGDFSGLGVTIWDPLTRVNTGTQASPVWTAQQSFAGNVIPANRINPIAKKVLEYWAKPKNSGLVGNIFDSTLNENTKPYDNYTFRIDQNVTSNNRLFVRGSVYNRNSLYNKYTGNAYTGVNFIFKARQGVIDDVHTFNSTTFLNVRYGYNRFIRGQDQQSDAQGFDLTQLGFTSAYNSLVPEDVRRFPRFDFTGGPLGNGMSNEVRPVDTHSFAVTLNKILGTHSLKFGSELRIYREDDIFRSNDQTGQFAFDNTYTRQASNGATNQDVNGLQGYAAFLLGLPTSMSITRRADYSEFSKTYGFFAQDDWKFNQKLTLNFGLRWEVETPLQERNDKSVSGFDLSYTQPFQQTVKDRLTATPVTGVDPATFTTRGGLLFAGKDGDSNLYNTPKNVFLPRFGLAYQWDDKTVIRGGVGVFAGFLGERRGDVIQPGYTRTTTFGLSALANGSPIPFTIDNFPSITIQEPVGNSQGKQAGLGGGISFFNPNPEVSRQVRYQVGVQRQLPWGFVAEAVYVGNYGYNIEITRNINALPNQYLNADNFRSAAQVANNTFLTAQVANPFRNIAEFAGTGFGTNANIARSQLLRPFPQFGDINTTVNDGKSWYHSGQFSLNKRFSDGFTFGASYTWSKWLQATEYLNAGDDKPTRMISDQDTPHRLSISGIYELPFGKGKAFLSDNAVLDRFVGGWQIQGVYAFQVGFPIRLGNDAFISGNSTELSIDSSLRNTSRWFNTGYFLNVVDGATSTNATPVSHLRTLPFFFADFRRDNINNVDLSMLKNTRINERMRIQFKLDLINAFNEPYFVAPVVNPTQTTFGQISASNQDNYARRIQFGIKFLF
ncbi:MAG TPA: TonB-dependent receptor [Pyrinomonadaceae bacterium]|nr:TonB-dependent receptor [Pyrinomonadaceae bacterium]